MAAAAMKHMASNFSKLDKFEGVDFRRWQKKMHFLLSSMSVVYVLTTPIPEDGGDDATVEQIRKRAKWDNDDYVCRGLILNEAKYMVDDASSKKFLVSNFTNPWRPNIWLRMHQKDFKHTLKHLKEELTLIELGSHLRIEVSLKVHDSDKPKGNNVASPSVVNMVEHNNSSRDCKGVNVGNKANGSGTKGSVDGSSNSLKGQNMFNKSLQTYESLNDGSILYMGNESTALMHGRGCVDLRLNIVNDNIASTFMSTSKLNDSIIWHARLGHVRFKRMQDMSKDGLTPAFDIDTDKAVVRNPSQILKTLGERGIECIFVGYAEHSKAFRFYVIEPNDSVLINSIIESRDAIFDYNGFSSVPRPSLRIPNGTEDIGGSVVPEEVVQQPKPELRKSKKNRTPKNFEPEFQLYLIKGTMDEDVAFWKEAIIDEMDSIMGNNTWVLADLPPEARISTIRLLIAMASIHNLIIHQMDMKTAFLNGELDEEVYMNQPQDFIIPGNENKVCKLIKSLYGLNKFDESSKGVIICLYVDEMLIFGTDQVQVDLTKEFLSSRFSMKDIGEANIILVSTPMDTSEKLMPNKGLAVSQLEYSRVISCLMYAMTCTRPDIAFAVVLEGYTDASWISNTEDNSSTSGWVFLLGGGAISWASKK
ncbi:zinc finger, CCHC-type containing protein [Tanacetum coccineum]